MSDSNPHDRDRGLGSAMPSGRDDAITSRARRPIADDLAPKHDTPESGDVADAADDRPRDKRGDGGTRRLTLD